HHRAVEAERSGKIHRQFSSQESELSGCRVRLQNAGSKASCDSAQTQRQRGEGITAVGYHADMDSTERKKNQECWMADEVNVLVGTVAFGLGINKSAGREVVH